VFKHYSDIGACGKTKARGGGGEGEGDEGMTMSLDEVLSTI